ncbi:MAG: hypothetical protein LBL41_02575 [Bifidobacteriaceae bacterium]|nr:hypothetical protein [Bifidobacteriaceae bacterium]
MTLAVFAVFMFLLQFSQLTSFYGPLLFSGNVSVSGKLDILGNIAVSAFTPTFSLNFVLVLIVAFLQGVVLTAILYIKVFKRKELEEQSVCEVGKSVGVSSGIGAVVSFFGVGCAPCQTALISPLLALITAGGASLVVSEIIMDSILVLAGLLSLYAIFKMLEQLKGYNV